MKTNKINNCSEFSLITNKRKITCNQSKTEIEMRNYVQHSKPSSRPKSKTFPKQNDSEYLFSVSINSKFETTKLLCTINTRHKIDFCREKKTNEI